MAWLSGALAVACLVVGLLHLLRLVVLRRDVMSEASNAAMGLGMAAMFSPLGNPVPASVWAMVFGPCCAWFAVSALRPGPAGSLRAHPPRADAAHHVVAGGAMLFMLFAGHSHAPVAEHADHGGAAAGPGAVSAAAIVLTGYFAWHVLRCSDRLQTAGPWTVLAPRTAAAAHLTMAAAMTVMLLGMV